MLSVNRATPQLFAAPPVRVSPHAPPARAAALSRKEIWRSADFTPAHLDSLVALQKTTDDAVITRHLERFAEIAPIVRRAANLGTATVLYELSNRAVYTPEVRAAMQTHANRLLEVARDQTGAHAVNAPQAADIDRAFKRLVRRAGDARTKVLFSSNVSEQDLHLHLRSLVADTAATHPKIAAKRAVMLSALAAHLSDSPALMTLAIAAARANALRAR